MGAAPPKGDALLLAWSRSGELALVQESVQGPMGGSSLSFRVVGPGVLQKRFEVSNDIAGRQGLATERISPEDCRAALVELRDLLRSKSFQGIHLQGEACRSDRSAAITVAQEQAEETEAAELEPSSTGDSLVRGSLRVRLEAASLTLEGPRQRKKLRLPRLMHPASVHVLLSPTHRLLLILESVDGGDQVLAAGYSSKTGEIADFE